jgi:hypothetical protein
MSSAHNLSHVEVARKKLGSFASKNAKMDIPDLGLIVTRTASVDGLTKDCSVDSLNTAEESDTLGSLAML